MVLMQVQHQNTLHALQTSEQSHIAAGKMTILRETEDVFQGEGHLAGKLKLKTDSSGQLVRTLKKKVPLAQF